MSTGTTAQLGTFAKVLGEAGYAVELRELASQDVLLAESPYALVAVMEATAWDGLVEHVSDVQASLTKLAETAPSVRRWDLYLFVHVTVSSGDPTEDIIAEEIESDTRYARKFVRAVLPADDVEALDRALRPLLPLRSPAAFDLSEPLDAVRRELRELKLPDQLADAAIDSFMQGKEVKVV